MKVSLETRCIVLNPKAIASTELKDDSLYERLNTSYDDFSGHQLISAYHFSEDWASWECHPHGDEVIILQSGHVVVRTESDGNTHSTSLNEINDTFIVPAKTWHTMKVLEPSRVLFVTPGEGTRHRPA